MTVENAQTTETSAEYSRVDAVEELTNFYASQSEAPADEPVDETAEVETDETPDPPEEIPAEPDEDPEDEPEEKEVDEAEEAEEAEKTDQDEEPEIGESDFDALDNPTTLEEIKPEDYPDVAALKEKYPRQKAELYEEAARYAEKARKGDETILKMGGEELIEPVSKIVTGLRTSDPQSFFEGIVEAGSSESLLDVTGHSTYLALIKAKEWAANTEVPELAEIGTAMIENTNATFVAAFGEGITLDIMHELVQLHKIGLTEAWARWKDQEYVDSSEFDSMVEASNNPEQFASLREKSKKTEAELTEARKKLDAQETTKASAVEAKFASESAAQIEKSLTEIVWAKSVLKELASDTAELKETKAEFRSNLIAIATKAFKTSDDYRLLETAYKRGDGNNLKFRESLTRAMNKTLLTIKEKNSIYERTIAGLYGKQRNFQLAKKKTANGNQTAGGKNLAPTETQVSEQRPMTQDEIVEQMTAQIRALG